MSVWAAGAVVGAAVIGVAGSAYSADKASGAANKASKRASDADAARLGFEREQYDEWQATYGPIEDSLAAYYNTLSPTIRATQGLEAFEKEKNIALTNMRENLAQRGIDMSGIAAEQELQIAVGSAEERARIRAEAPINVAKEKLGFLQVGLGQDPSEGMSGALTDAQRNAQRNELITARNAGQASGAVVDSFTDLAQAGFTAGMEWWQNRPSTTTGGSGSSGRPGV